MKKSKKPEYQLPFQFPTVKEREVPAHIAEAWHKASYYFFFHNGLADEGAITDFLKAQPLSTLDTVAAAFDVEIIDAVAQAKRAKKLVPVSQKDVDAIIASILPCITQ